VERAAQAAREAETILGYATIRSPLDGIIVDKRVEVGDTATPGQVLLTLYDPTRMQLIARVRESLTQRLQVGQDIDVHVSALGKTCTGRVSEIVPEAEAASRTFSVKVTGPCPEGVYTGMFGRLLIPLDDEQVLLIPQAAVRRIGQLDVVDVVVRAPDETQAEPRVQRRTVQLGRDFGEDVEVLAGLQAGELVALGTGAAAVP
jgi:RND family efflux transporter MFP subunit